MAIQTNYDTNIGTTTSDFNSLDLMTINVEDPADANHSNGGLRSAPIDRTFLSQNRDTCQNSNDGVAEEAQVFNSGNTYWANFMISDPDGHDAAAAAYDPLGTFTFWNFDLFESNVSDQVLPQPILQSMLQPSIQVTPIDTTQCPGQDHTEGCEMANFVLPPLSTEDQQTIGVDYFGHLENVSHEAFHRLKNWYKQVAPGSQGVIVREVIHAFLELYFEYFADQFDFLHPSSLEGKDVSWILLLGVAAIGSQYCHGKLAADHATPLQELFYKAVQDNFSNTTLPLDCLTWAQIILLRDICLVFGGGKQRQIKHLYGRNILPTLCRLMSISPSERAKSRESSRPLESIETDWRRWVGLESRNRLLHTVYYFESLQFIFLQTRPSAELSEWSTNVPASAALWECRTAHEWMQASRLRHGSTYAQPDTSPVPKSTPEDAYMAKLRFTYICVQENLTLERLLKWPVRQFLPHHAGRPDSIQADNTTELYGQVAACVGSRLETFYPQNPERMPTPSLHRTSDVIFPLFSMLRHVRLRTLYAFSRWQASDDQVESARMELTTWITDQPILSRWCLFQATVVFSSLRVKTYFACYDPLCLLISSLFIWTYDQLLPSPSLSGVSPGLHKVLRLDRLSDTETIRDWIQNGIAVRLHITGVGVLDGATSPSRTLQEYRRVLLSRIGWNTMCSSLADLANEVIHGREPIMT